MESFDPAYDPPRKLPGIGDLVRFYGDTDWVWVDTVPYDAPLIGDEEMIPWRSYEVAVVLSRPKKGDGYLFVELLLPFGIGYYYADQLIVISRF